MYDTSLNNIIFEKLLKRRRQRIRTHKNEGDRKEEIITEKRR